MEAPKCKLCGEKHYGLCNQINRRSDTRAAENRGLPPLGPPATDGARTAEDGGKSHGTGKQAKFDRNAYHRTYMKEYMRKRRAKEKT